jgi:hypothetical protein
MRLTEAGEVDQWKLPWEEREIFETPALCLGPVEIADYSPDNLQLMMPDGSIQFVHQTWIRQNRVRELAAR